MKSHILILPALLVGLGSMLTLVEMPADGGGAAHFKFSLISPAFAKDGEDDSSGDDSSGDDDSGDDSSGDDDSSDDDSSDDDSGSGSGSDEDTEEDNSGPGNRNDRQDEDRSGSSNRNDSDDDDSELDRPEIILNLTNDELRQVIVGNSVVIDDLGRVLEVEIESENGEIVVKAKPHGGDARRNPGPIGDVQIISMGISGSAARVLDENRVVEIEVEESDGDGADAQDGDSVLDIIRDLLSGARVLTPDEEDAAIAGGWQ